MAIQIELDRVGLLTIVSAKVPVQVPRHVPVPRYVDVPHEQIQEVQVPRQVPVPVPVTRQVYVDVPQPVDQPFEQLVSHMILRRFISYADGRQ